MMNFDYLKFIPELEQLHNYCTQAEQWQTTNPETSAINARRGLEWLVRAVYKLMDVPTGERDSLFSLIDRETFKNFVDDGEVMKRIHWVRKFGNHAAHTGQVTRTEAFYTLVNLYEAVRAILLKLRVFGNIAPFDRTLIPERPRRPRIQVPVKQHDEKTQSDFAGTVPPEAVAEAPKVEVTLSWENIDEAQTRRMLIDLMLREAGWKVMETAGEKHPATAGVEIEVEGMPTPSGHGRADYVLFGADGRPLAVVEAKRTSVDPHAGEEQARLYADALEREYGVRPVIYFTNGYEIWVIDGMGYPKRQLYAFHSREDLEWLHQQRRRRDITDMSVKDAIANRYYQKTAIKKLCEHFNAKHRRGLLVMATGTGKTRTAIALVDVLQRAGWVKNTLFLADRTSLVKQAHRNFVKLMPDTSTCILSEDENPDLNARIVFSTYQTMIRYVDSETKPFSVGRFDLIVIDEAHRSVFGKYGAIFNYFDSLLTGLTATPRDQVDRSTYELLQLEGGMPNFSYELEEAVGDGYLVAPKGLKYRSKVIESGIKYDDLTDEEKEQLEKVWEYEAALADSIEPQPRDIISPEINKYIFNTQTIDRVLQELMERGLKVDSGEKIGKTIIFAHNSEHANLIVRRFNILYPDLGPDFCRQIDYSIRFAQGLIDSFSEREKEPQIAVSVDMLDTGIDVPDILNLVFFKQIRSRIKFMQMVGRGTRLCPDIYGPGKDKEKFLIFDWCNNIEFFQENIEDLAAPQMQSLTERIFSLRADILYCLQDPELLADEYAASLRQEIMGLVRKQIGRLSDNHISVRKHWDEVCRFRSDEVWTHLKGTDIQVLKSVIAPLVAPIREKADSYNSLDSLDSLDSSDSYSLAAEAAAAPARDDVKALKFDVLALNILLSMLDESVDGNGAVGKVTQIVNLLRERASVPQIMAKMKLLNEVLTPDFWKNKTLERVERMRIEIRELMKYLTGEAKRSFEVTVDDMTTSEGEVVDFIGTVTYRQKVLDYLAENRNSPVLRKIVNIEQLTADDVHELERVMWQELGTREDYNRFLSRENLAGSCGDSVAAFIRTIVKVDHRRALELFTEYISANTLTAEQEEYLKSIIDYVCANGDMEKSALINESPFDAVNILDLFPGKVPQVASFVALLHSAIHAA